MKKKIIIYGSIAVVIIAIATIGIVSYKHKDNVKPAEAKTIVEKFVNTYLMQAGSTVTISNVTESYGLYKMTISVGSGQTVDSYVTKDGKLFFPQALNISETEKAASGTNTNSKNDTNATPTNVSKTDKPTVELFVMSYCPYGNQKKKGILPVVSALGKKIDFKVKFCDYSMHGEKELKENLTQYCIQKEEPSKFNDYLSCFLKSGDSATCLTGTKIDKDKNDSCVSKTDNDFKVMANFKSNTGFQGTYPGFDVNKTDNTKYNVGGSPTLIINGTEVTSGRDSASLLKTICSAFNEQPEECKATLSSNTPTAGFGEGTTNSGSAAGCGQ